MLKILRILHSLLCWIAAYLIIIFLGHLIIGPISWFIKDKKGIYHWGAQVWAKSVLALANIKTRVEGLENISKEKNYIFATNHSSILDIYILSAALPQRFLFVMREDLFKIPLLGKYCKDAGYLSLNLTNPIKSARNIENIIKLVREGESIVYFPQGGRKQGLQEFKSGIAKIALETQAPVIPIAISGSAKLMPRKSFTFSPGIIKVSVGKPMQFDENTSYQEVADKIREAISFLLRVEP